MATYQTKVILVEAIQLTGELILSNGVPGSVGKAGDWLVQYPTGQQVIMKDKAFKEEFVLKPTIAREVVWPAIGDPIPTATPRVSPWTSTYKSDSQVEREIDLHEGNRG